MGKGGRSWQYLRMNGKIFLNYNGRPQLHTSGGSLDGKILLDFFFTPAQKRHQGSGINCWRMCGSDKANLYHLFWDCPKLMSYWHDIHDCLEYIFQITIQFDISSMYFGIMVFHTQSVAAKYLMKMLLIGAKKSITMKWIQPSAPTLEDWQGTVQEIYIMERLTFTLKLQSDKFKR